MLVCVQTSGHECCMRCIECLLPRNGTADTVGLELEKKFSSTAHKVIIGPAFVAEREKGVKNPARGRSKGLRDGGQVLEPRRSGGLLADARKLMQSPLRKVSSGSGAPLRPVPAGDLVALRLMG